MRPITIVMPYYENPGMLAEHFRLWRALPDDLKASLQVIVVDDGSPAVPASLPAEPLGFPFALYRMGVDVRWNQDACRNLGAHMAETDWILMTDIDHAAPENTLRRVMAGELRSNIAYMFARVSMPDLLPYKSHPNSWLLTRSLFERSGGYDERFAGLYGTDGLFKGRLSKMAVVLTLKEHLIRYPREVVVDASTTQYERKTEVDRLGIPAMREKIGKLPGWDQRPRCLTFPWSLVGKC